MLQLSKISNLLTKYCNEEEILTFKNNCESPAVNGLLLNSKYDLKAKLLNEFPTLISSDIDKVQFFHFSKPNKKGGGFTPSPFLS